MPTQPWSTACATNASQDSPAATVDDDPATGRVVALVVGRDAGGRDLDDRAGEALVGDHDVAAAGRGRERARRPRRTCGPRRPGRPRSSARTQVRAGPPSRNVVWSREELRHAATATGLPSTVSPAQVTRSAMVRSSRQVPSISTSVPSLGDHDRLGELGAELGDPARLAELLVDVPRGEGQGEHAVRDHVWEADAAGDLGVLVDRVGVAAGRGVGDQGLAGDRVRRRSCRSVLITHPPCGRGSPRRCRPARPRRR